MKPSHWLVLALGVICGLGAFRAHQKTKLEESRRAERLELMKTMMGP